MALEFTDTNFEELALKSDKPVVVDFTAKWCSPCRIIGTYIEQMATDYEGKAIIGKLDIESSPGVARKYQVLNIPTVLFIKNGEVKDKQVGSVAKTVLVQKLDALL
jgi:thioredoxin 1